ncbi:MAG: hypothetical protein ABIW79_00105 [Gemmatimonas sp.]
MRARRSGAVTAAMLAMGLTARVPPVHAQGPRGTCSTSGAGFNGGDVCQKARDLFSFVAPQIGVAVAGGNPIPGDAGSLGGFGKRALSLRMVVVDAHLPRNSVPLTAGAAAGSDFGQERTVMPLPAVDGAIGVFAGAPLGLTNVGGVDLLAGATYLPHVSRNAFELRAANGGFGFSYGVRVGVLQESSVVPGLGVSWQRRQLPTSDFSYMPSNDTLVVNGTSVRADALRAVISKRFALFGLAAGVGRDRIVSESNMSAVVNESAGNSAVRQTVSLTGLRESTERNTAFVNASFSLIAFRIVAEYGRSSAGTLRETVNSFGGRRANEAYNYGSLGITARF